MLKNNVTLQSLLVCVVVQCVIRLSHESCLKDILIETYTFRLLDLSVKGHCELLFAVNIWSAFNKTKQELKYCFPGKNIDH